MRISKNILVLPLLVSLTVSCESRSDSPEAVSPKDVEEETVKESTDPEKEPPVAVANPVRKKGKTCHRDLVEVAEMFKIKSRSYQCYALQVPKDYENPNAGSVRVDAVVISGDDKSLDPLTIEQGGPGASSIKLAFLSHYSFKQHGLPSPTLVAIEQRGTKHTGNYVPMEVACSSGQDEDSCEQSNSTRLTEVIPGLTNISTPNIARDVFYGTETLVGAFGNFYGVSYGGIVGQHLGNLFDDRVKKIVLDSAPDLGWDWNSLSDKSLMASLAHLDKLCRVSKCSQPNIAGKLMDIKKRTPVEGVDVRGRVVDFQSLKAFARSHMKNTAKMSELRDIIDKIHRDGFAILTPYFLDLIVPEDKEKKVNDSPLMYFKIYCSEAHNTDLWGEKDPFESICGAFESNRVTIEDIQFDTSTLVLAGKLDPVVPPERSKRIADHLNNAKFIAYDNQTHGTLKEKCTIKRLWSWLKTGTLKSDPNCGKDLSDVN